MAKDKPKQPASPANNDNNMLRMSWTPRTKLVIFTCIFAVATHLPMSGWMDLKQSISTSASSLVQEVVVATPAHAELQQQERNLSSGEPETSGRRASSSGSSSGGGPEDKAQLAMQYLQNLQQSNPTEYWKLFMEASKGAAASLAGGDDEKKTTTTPMLRTQEELPRDTPPVNDVVPKGVPVVFADSPPIQKEAPPVPAPTSPVPAPTVAAATAVVQGTDPPTKAPETPQPDVTTDNKTTNNLPQCTVVLENKQDYHYEIFESVMLRYPIPWEKLEPCDTSKPVLFDVAHADSGWFSGEVAGWREYFHKYLQNTTRPRADGTTVQFRHAMYWSNYTQARMQHTAKIGGSCGTYHPHNWLKGGKNRMCVQHKICVGDQCGKTPEENKETIARSCWLNNMRTYLRLCLSQKHTFLRFY